MAKLFADTVRLRVAHEKSMRAPDTKFCACDIAFHNVTPEKGKTKRSDD